MKQLVLTGLGNEVDLKTGRTVFTAIFNDAIRIEISQEAAQTLTSNIYGNGDAVATRVKASSDDYSRPPEQESEYDGETFGGNGVIGSPVLEDALVSVYDEDTGIEQV